MKALRYLSLFLISALLGCAPTNDKPLKDDVLKTPGAVLTTLSIARGVPATSYRAYGAASYIPVSREWLSQTLYSEYAAQLGRAGLWKNGRPRFSKNTQCNYFADKMVTVAQERFFHDRFHSFDSTESPAVGVIWYLKGGAAEQGHAINVALLEDGTLVFFEPQNPGFMEIKLTPAEMQSIWFVRF